MADVLLIEGCNFVDYPKGGQLSFARHLIHIYGERLALVGWSTDAAPVGCWFRRRLDGRLFDCFNIGRRVPLTSRPPVPDRLFTYLTLRRHHRAIFAHAPRDVFIQAPEVLFAVHDLPWNSLCYRFAGVNNPLRLSRYPLARPLASAFKRSWVRALQSADLLLASADRAAIEDFARGSGDPSLGAKIISFPTRFDDAVFVPGDQAAARAALGIPSGGVCLVCVGRLNRAKGWDFLLRAFQLFRRDHQDALLFFVGDGEDRSQLLGQASVLGLDGAMRCTLWPADRLHRGERCQRSGGAGGERLHRGRARSVRLRGRDRAGAGATGRQVQVAGDGQALRPRHPGGGPGPTVAAAQGHQRLRILIGRRSSQLRRVCLAKSLPSTR